MERVVVTGIGLVSPLGSTVADFWAGLLAGHSGVVALEDPEFANHRTRIGARAQGFDPLDHFDRKELRRMSRTSQMAIVAAAQAVTDACLTEGQVDKAEVGVLIGSSIGGFSASDPAFRDYYRLRKASPLIIPISMNSGPSSNVSIRYGFQGPLFSVDAACATAAHSIGYAFRMIRSGVLEVCITGGADSPFSPGVLEAWCELRALSERNDTPATACRPFSADRDGLVLGEGAGILILESESSASRRGARILAEITGYAATGDGFHITQPSLGGPVRAMSKALKDAGLTPEEIDYINAHATATEYNDKNETAAIKKVFGGRAYRIPVVGNKAALGHSIGASGALELISALLSIRDQIVPPTINYHVPDPDCDLDYVTDARRPWAIRHAMSNSFAFGGSNAVLIASQYTP